MSNTDSGDSAQFASGGDPDRPTAEESESVGASRWQRELPTTPQAPLWKRRSVWLSAALVIVVVAGAGLAVSWLGGDGDVPANAGSSSICTFSDGSSEPPSDPIAAPKKGDVTVKEKGAFNYSRHYHGDYSDYVSFGATFKNTSNSVAYHTNIDFTLTDREGHKLTANNQQFETMTHQQISVLRQGKSAGLGGTIKIPNRDFTKDLEDVKVSVKVGDSQWWPAHSKIKRLHQGHYNHFQYNTMDSDAMLNVEWDVTSCQPVPGIGASTVLRDSYGDIIGGTPSYPANGVGFGESDVPLEGVTADILVFHQPGLELLDILDADATEATVYPEHVNCDTGKLTAKAENIANTDCLIDMEYV